LFDISVHKSIVESESDYFKAMFNQWTETNNCLELKETLYKPLIIVLKIVYGFDINHKEFDEYKIQELNEALIIANKYQFIRVEKLLSLKIISKFPPIHRINCQEFQQISDIFQMSSNFNSNKETNILEEECLKFFDKNSIHLIKKFDNFLISHQLLLKIISRDSFDVREIDLFNSLMVWIGKSRLKYGFDFYEEEVLLLQMIRFKFISAEDMNNIVKPEVEKLFKKEVMNEIIDDLINGFTNQTKRCFKSETIPTIDEIKNKVILKIIDLFEVSKRNDLLFMIDKTLNCIYENSDLMLNIFDKLSISHETLYYIISRDSFGVKEIDLFNALIKWILKTRQKVKNNIFDKEELLLKAIRYYFITEEDMKNIIRPKIRELLKPLFSDIVIDSKIDDLIDCHSNRSNRICIQTEKLFTVKKDQTIHTYYEFNNETKAQELVPKQELPSSQSSELKLTQNNSIMFTFNLDLMTKINCIEFEIIPINNCREDWDKLLMDYIIEVRNINYEIENNWVIVANHKDTKRFQFKRFYFKEIVTNAIRIVQKSNEELFEICSLSYKYTKIPLIKAKYEFHFEKAVNIVQPMAENRIIITPAVIRQTLNKETTDPEIQRIIGQQLVLLLHAQKCQRREEQQQNGGNGPIYECFLPHCHRMRDVINHMNSCTVFEDCIVDDCVSSRLISSHWNDCTRDDCPVCLPLRQGSDRRAREFQDIKKLLI
jgi:hypothetical protein